MSASSCRFKISGGIFWFIPRKQVKLSRPKILPLVHQAGCSLIRGDLNGLCRMFGRRILALPRWSFKLRCYPFPILLDITRRPDVIGVVPTELGTHWPPRLGRHGSLNYSVFLR